MSPTSPPPLPIQRPTHTRWKRVFGLIAVAVSLSLLMYFWPPGSSLMYPPCLLHRITGFHCPGCGVTRAAHSLMHGAFGVAARNNLLFVCSLPWMGYWILPRLHSWFQGSPLPSISVPPRGAAWALLVLALFGILRNFPFEPFRWLAPP